MKLPQDTVDQSNRPTFTQFLRGTRGLIDRGMVCHPQIEQLIESEQQQGGDVTILGLEWFLQQLLQQPLQAWQPAHDPVTELLNQTAVTGLRAFAQMLRQGIRQGASLQDLLQDLCRHQAGIAPAGAGRFGCFSREQYRPLDGR